MDFEMTFANCVDLLFDKLKSHMENLRGKCDKCRSWCAKRQWFGREGWRWTVVKWLCYLGIGVLSIPSMALGLVCVGVLLVGLAGAVVAALGLVVALLSLLLVTLPLYVMAYLMEFGIFGLICLVLGRDFRANDGSSSAEPSDEPSDEPSSEPSSGGTVELVVPRLEESSSSPKEESSSESTSSEE